MSNKIKITSLAVAGAILSLGFAGVASAQTPTPTDTVGVKAGWGRGMEMGMRKGGGVFGSVTAISGNTITITSQARGPKGTPPGTTGTPPTPTTTTYTVDASAATVDKAGVASSVSSIAVGDTIVVEGTVTGTNVVATKIHDGIVPRAGGMGMMGKNPGTSTMPTGNGQPIVGGTVSTVSGNTITLTNSSNATYTVDATSAKITKAGVAGTITDVVVGDSVLVQGTVNGTSVTAVSVTDSGAKPVANSSTTTANAGAHKGFFGSIGNFFSKLFGF